MDAAALLRLGMLQERASLQHKIKNLLLGRLGLRSLIEIQVQLSRGQLDL